MNSRTACSSSTAHLGPPMSWQRRQRGSGRSWLSLPRSAGSKDWGWTSSSCRCRKRSDAASPANVALAEEGGFFYLTGGDPGLVVDVLRDTPVWRAMLSAWRSGAMLAGSSAGAMAFGEWTLVRKAYPGHARRRYKPALDLVPRLAVAPHFETFGHRSSVWSATNSRRVWLCRPGSTIRFSDQLPRRPSRQTAPVAAERPLGASGAPTRDPRRKQDTAQRVGARVPTHRRKSVTLPGRHRVGRDEPAAASAGCTATRRSWATTRCADQSFRPTGFAAASNHAAVLAGFVRGRPPGLARCAGPGPARPWAFRLDTASRRAHRVRHPHGQQRRCAHHVRDVHRRRHARGARVHFLARAATRWPGRLRAQSVWSHRPIPRVEGPVRPRPPGQAETPTA